MGQIDQDDQQTLRQQVVLADGEHAEASLVALEVSLDPVVVIIPHQDLEQGECAFTRLGVV